MYIYINEKCVGGDSGREVYTLSHNLLLAHAEAVEEFRKCAKCKDGKIGIVQSPMWFEPYKKSSSDEVVKRAMDFTLALQERQQQLAEVQRSFLQTQALTKAQTFIYHVHVTSANFTDNTRPSPFLE